MVGPLALESGTKVRCDSSDNRRAAIACAKYVVSEARKVDDVSVDTHHAASSNRPQLDGELARCAREASKHDKTCRATLNSISLSPPQPRTTSRWTHEAECKLKLVGNEGHACFADLRYREVQVGHMRVVKVTSASSNLAFLPD